MTDQLPTHPVEATLERSNDRWVLQMERTLGHPAERVWAALTRAEEVRRWAPYAPDRDLDVLGEVPLPQAEDGEPAEGPPEPGEVLVADSPRLLVVDWGGHLLRFEITPVPEGVRVPGWTARTSNRSPVPPLATSAGRICATSTPQCS
jgi:uncharacterized protein YndB with AHSA1/START domain